MAGITYFCSEEIAPKSWMIKNAGESTPAICYLVEGCDYALLIDSIIGIGNLKAFSKHRALAYPKNRFLSLQRTWRRRNIVRK